MLANTMTTSFWNAVNQYTSRGTDDLQFNKTRGFTSSTFLEGSDKIKGALFQELRISKGKLQFFLIKKRKHRCCSHLRKEITPVSVGYATILRKNNMGGQDVEG
jgi:hypothetical protein